VKPGPTTRTTRIEAKWREDRLLEEHRQLLEAVSGWDWGKEGMAQMPVEPEPRHGGHEWNFTQYGDELRATLLCTWLLGLGPVTRTWVRAHAAEALLHKEYDPARHLREGGRMMWLVDRAILTALRKKNLLSPGPDLLWAVDRDAAGYCDTDWELCLRHCTFDGAVSRRKVVEGALASARALMGLRPSTLSRSPETVKRLHAAIDRLVASGEITLVRRS
jgi:hypothetical protein